MEPESQNSSQETPTLQIQTAVPSQSSQILSRLPSSQLPENSITFPLIQDAEKLEFVSQLESASQSQETPVDANSVLSPNSQITASQLQANRTDTSTAQTPPAQLSTPATPAVPITDEEVRKRALAGLVTPPDNPSPEELAAVGVKCRDFGFLLPPIPIYKPAKKLKVAYGLPERDPESIGALYILRDDYRPRSIRMNVDTRIADPNAPLENDTTPPNSPRGSVAPIPETECAEPPTESVPRAPQSDLPDTVVVASEDVGSANMLVKRDLAIRFIPQRYYRHLVDRLPHLDGNRFRPPILTDPSRPPLDATNADIDMDELVKLDMASPFPSSRKPLETIPRLPCDSIVYVASLDDYSAAYIAKDVPFMVRYEIPSVYEALKRILPHVDGSKLTPPVHTLEARPLLNAVNRQELEWAAAAAAPAEKPVVVERVVLSRPAGGGLRRTGTFADLTDMAMPSVSSRDVMPPVKKRVHEDDVKETPIAKRLRTHHEPVAGPSEKKTTIKRTRKEFEEDDPETEASKEHRTKRQMLAALVPRYFMRDRKPAAKGTGKNN